MKRRNLSRKCIGKLQQINQNCPKAAITYKGVLIAPPIPNKNNPLRLEHTPPPPPPSTLKSIQAPQLQRHGDQKDLEHIFCNSIM